MAFRPCIDLKDGRVVQIVGGSLTEDDRASINHVSQHSAADFAALYQRDNLRGGHVIMLGLGNEEVALSALRAYPGGLQVGGGITPDNAQSYLDAGASHVIVTSYLFHTPPRADRPTLDSSRVRQMREAIDKNHLVIDLSCRREPSGEYFVATNRWRTLSETRVDADLIASLEDECDEFLIHAADVEGKQDGIDQELVEKLGEWVTIPTTYAGGARSLEEIVLVEQLSDGKIDLTIGSALDIFGGSRVRYEDAARLGRRG